MVGLGGVGFVDDLIKIRRQRSLGLRARAKFAGQLIVTVAFAIWRCTGPTSTATPGLDPPLVRARHRRDRARRPSGS